MPIQGWSAVWPVMPFTRDLPPDVWSRCHNELPSLDASCTNKPQAPPSFFVFEPWMPSVNESDWVWTVAYTYEK
jgi:hypothetical protein